MIAKPAPVIQKSPRQNRMTLAAVTRGIIRAPYRMVVHGKDGVGKSTFAAGAPRPVFLGAEDGTKHIDVDRFPAPETWEDMLDAVRTLTAEASDFKTFVLDTSDWAEPFLWRHICKQSGVESIEEVGGGYGKGYQAAIDGWRVFLAALERLQRERGMNVVLLAHSVIKKFANPEGEDYERYVIAMHDKSAALMRQWAEAVYFADFETFAESKRKGEKVKGISTGARVLKTQPAAAYDAKDRYFVPEVIPLDWGDFEAAVSAAAPVDLTAIRSEVERKAKAIGGEVEAKTLAYLAKNGTDSAALSKLNDRLNAKLAEKREQEGN